MNVLFVHQNFPGQYIHVARALAASPDNQVCFITQRRDANIRNVRKLVYAPRAPEGLRPHPFLRDSETGVINALAVAQAAQALKRAGFVPDVMAGHNGWGEIWFLKEIFPQAPLIGYFEFFYNADGADVGFDPEIPRKADSGARLRIKNAGNLIGLQAVDRGQTPTRWQQSTYPAIHRERLNVVHDGIDTDIVVPDADARLRLPDSEIEFRAGDEVVTYVSRNLEHYRGFHIFMRALPKILAARPHAHVIVVGGDEISYGPKMPAGTLLRHRLLDELGDSLDRGRVHFIGKVPYATYLNVLRVSRAHVYLTYPFVLSWSMLEAMSAGCLVIGSRTPPVEEAIRDGENGLLTDFFDTGALADRVIAALEEPRQFEPLRRRARESMIEAYDLKRICLPRQMESLRSV